jgi:hypothetical protein
MHSEGIAYKPQCGEVGMCPRVGWMGPNKEDGPGHRTRTGVRAPGVKRETACTEVFISALPLTQCMDTRRTQRARRAMANQCSGKAASETPALKPYRGKPAVRNFREDDGNVGIIRSPLRAIVLPDR